MSVQVSLAGRLEVETDHRTLDATRLPGRQGREVLAYLVMERGRPVPGEELAEVLWGSTPPPTWRPALRGAVSKVRRFLAALELPAQETLTSASGCYQLVLPSDATVDVELAASEADAAERALADGDLERALAAAETARALAGRPLLPGQEGAWVERRRAAWQQVLVRALQVLVDTRLAEGRGDAAVQPATEMVALEPFRESAHLRLLRAHAAAGDRGEALRAYEHCRRLLAEELGVDPSPELEAAYLHLLRDGAATLPLSLPTRHRQAQPAVSPPSEVPFVGRDPELARLRAAWAGVRAGRRRLVLVTGEAGIGKSRLAGKLAAIAERDGAIVLFGRCDERLGVSYLPLQSALRPYLAACTPERLRVLAGSHGGELVRIWPELAGRLTDLPAPTRGGPKAERHLLSEAVCDLLDAIATGGPVLLVVDDLHQADQPSLFLLRRLANAAPPAPPLLLLLTARDDEAAGGELSQVLADLLRAPGADHLPLHGLDLGEIATVAETILGRPLGPEAAALARVLDQRTGGNPLFVVELLRHLTETDALAGGNIGWLVAGPAVEDVPDSLRLVVGQRLARLDGAVRHLLEAASVIGHRADLTLLNRVVDLGYDELLVALEAAVAAKLLEEQPGAPGRYAFRHGIVHDLVYTGLPATRRARLHHRVGEALEGPGGGADVRELADHFGLGNAADAAKAAGYAQQAGDEALSQLLYEEATYRYRQALAALDRGGAADEGRRGDLLLALGDAWTRAGEPARAGEAYLQAAASARADGSAERLARAALAVGGTLRFWSLQVDPATATALLREALSAVGERDSGLRALLLARLAGWLTVTASLGADEQPDPLLFSRAEELAHQLGDPGIVAGVLTDRAQADAGIVLGRPGGPQEALETSAELVRLAARFGGDRLMDAAILPRAEALLAAGDLDGISRSIQAQERSADGRRMPYRWWVSLVLRTMRAIMKGEFAMGERLMEQALTYGRDTVGEGTSLAYSTQLIFLRWLQGRPDDVRTIVEGLVRQPRGRGWRTLLLLAHPGQRLEAEAGLLAAAADGFAGRRSGAEVVGLVGACAQLGDGSAAAGLYELLLPYKGWHLSAGPMVYLGAGDHHLGVLAATAGRWDEARRHLLAAMVMHRRLNARPWLALTRQAYAGMLRGRDRRGDRQRAGTFDAASRVIAASLGMELPGWGRAALGPLPQPPPRAGGHASHGAQRPRRPGR